ncbi:ejaculatory bulb-specific protein 3-like [Chrysoperla carnea]|uniref:ejaculatory bulb-specific protein 3-like n=1 Tax=Chrysoperla carnea TaxID=189513 RepID=UPI001D072E3C|nr:ejaculatory bulb-specific protein 3-like [Chrysoperla carnea]
MFKLLSISFVIVAVVFAADEKYTTKYDNINLKDILESDRLLNNYVKCLKGTGKCTPDGSELKRVLPEALETGCAKCHENQKEGAREVITYLINKKPELWNELKEQYDPTGIYTEKYKKEYEEVLEKKN